MNGGDAVSRDDRAMTVERHDTVHRLAPEDEALFEQSADQSLVPEPVVIQELHAHREDALDARVSVGAGRSTPPRARHQQGLRCVDR